MAPTHRQNVLKKYKLEDKSYSLNELSKITGIPMSILQQVYNRGIGAYRSNPQSVRLKGSFKKGVNAPLSMKLSKEQWAFARVYSFIDGGHTQDDDLRKNSRSNIMRAPPPPPRKPMAESRDKPSSARNLKKVLKKEETNQQKDEREKAERGRDPGTPPRGGYAVGGTVHHGPILRRPHNHRMIGMTSFEHGMINKKVRYYNDSNNVSYAAFNQGGYFPGAEHQVI
jgi:hypothetical protein